MKRYQLSKVGETHISNEGVEWAITDGGSKNLYCTVSGTYREHEVVKEVVYNDLKKGQIKHPYFPSVYGVGYVGEGDYKTRVNGKMTPQYQTWVDMLQRCYDPKLHVKYPTYIGCIVHDDWHNFQVFCEWYDKQIIPVDGALDKDLLSYKNKEYSPETCVFIPRKLNGFMTNKHTNNVSGMTGVSWHKQHKKWRTQINDFETGKTIHLGLFTSKAEAGLVYAKARWGMAKQMFEWLKQLELDGKLDSRVCKAFVEYATSEKEWLLDNVEQHKLMEGDI